MNECFICFCKLTKVNKARLECNHTICGKCLRNQYMNDLKTCGLCRAEITEQYQLRELERIHNLTTKKKRRHKNNQKEYKEFKKWQIENIKHNNNRYNELLKSKGEKPHMRVIFKTILKILEISLGYFTTHTYDEQEITQLTNTIKILNHPYKSVNNMVSTLPTEIGNKILSVWCNRPVNIVRDRDNNKWTEHLKNGKLKLRDLRKYRAMFENLPDDIPRILADTIIKIMDLGIEHLLNRSSTKHSDIKQVIKRLKMFNITYEHPIYTGLLDYLPNNIDMLIRALWDD